MTPKDPAPRLIINLTRDVKLELAWIPPGEFLMGAYGEYPAEEPRHRVHITSGFYLGVFPVTQAQFEVFTRAQKIDHKNGFPGKPNHPAENMDWTEALGFCDWLNQNFAQEFSGFQATLPTEAQWEYACRAGTQTEYYTGDGEAALAEAGWYRGNSSYETQEVGRKLHNIWGLHDMHGNVDEWCIDEWDEFAYAKRVDGVEDPVVWDGEWQSRVRVVRGGGWNDSARYCRSSIRFRWSQDYRFRYLGFRACLALGPLVRRAESG